VQTDFPAHPVFAALQAHDYDRFARDLLREREAAQLPPVSHAALLLAEAHRREDIDAFLSHAHATACALVGDDAIDVTVYSPVPAVLARRAGFERGQLVVQSLNRAKLQRFIAQWRGALDAAPARRVRVSLDIDPASFC
jgi:primosomal protein N' (replication factor Y) (superfamily II helicase)